MATRGQVKRALEWERYLAIPRLKRGGAAPGCLTCGKESNGWFVKGEPKYPCSHEPFTIDDETLERGRREFGG